VVLGYLNVLCDCSNLPEYMSQQTGLKMHGHLSAPMEVPEHYLCPSLFYEAVTTMPKFLFVGGIPKNLQNRLSTKAFEWPFGVELLPCFISNTLAHFIM